MQTIPVEYNRGHNRLHTADLGIHSSNEATTVSVGTKEAILLPASRARRPITGVVCVIANQITV